MWGVDRMIEFIDETSEKDGTDINRSNMMAMQGYQGEDVTFGDTITKVNDKGEIETITFSDTQIIKQFVGEKTITQTITFTDTGYTKELS
jgi:hypothetical protein